MKRRIALPTISILTLAAALLVIASAATADVRSAGLTINWTIVLKGPALNGVVPTGNSDYEVENGARKFSADCDNVNVADGTTLDVLVNGKTVGSFTTQDGGGALLLTGSRAPYVSKGTKVSINFHHGSVILSGKF